jgi:LDH2 family malate/lactate/ureidoglycolate dehydrogenase
VAISDTEQEVRTLSDGYERVDAEKLTGFSAMALEKLGVPSADALITAKMLVACDLRGVESHGVAHLRMFYATRIRRGVINVTPSPVITSKAPSTALMDGDNGLGFVVGYHAMNDAIRRAADTGAGFIAVRNSTHFGAAAYYAMMALEHDMIGFAMTNAVPIVVAPGSSAPVAGTNPIAVAVPSGEKAPFVLDMATSAVAGGKLEIAARTESPRVPAGWLLDGEGNYVTEMSNRRRGDGGLAPLGGVAETGAYKGFGLALVVDILSGVLSGSVASLLYQSAPEARGNYSDHFFGALRIDSFIPVADFKGSMDSMLNAIEALPTVPGVDQVTVPGLYEAPIVADRQANGIPLHPKVIADLKLLAEELGIEYGL